MAALPAVPKGVRLDLHMTMGDDPNIQVREFYQYTGTLSSTDAGTWLAAIITAWTTFMHSPLSTAIHLVLSELTDLTSNTAPQVQNSTAASGTDANPPLPAGNAMLFKKVISRRYRGGHPRIYIPGMTTARLSTPSLWDPTALASFVGAYQAYIASSIAGAPVAVGTVTHVNISYFSGFTNHLYPSGRVKAIPTPRITPVVDPILNVVGNPNVASQRRRNEQP